jgi:hypothetical protein
MKISNIKAAVAECLIDLYNRCFLPLADLTGLILEKDHQALENLSEHTDGQLLGHLAQPRQDHI